MVRFIIRYIRKKIKNSLSIYIPLWLDLLYRMPDFRYQNESDLHSTMVRFIMIRQFRDEQQI